jgi:DNA primase
MARIADEVIERIKSEVSLVRLVESQGYALQKQGKDFALCCPFHADKTPSCVITPKSNLFNCFGCGAGGSVIDWVMKTQGISFRLACEFLQRDVSLVASVPAVPVKRATTKKLASPFTAASSDESLLLKQVVDFYHETLPQSPEALAYLEKRGLNCSELISAFKLGYANRTLCYRLPEKPYKAGTLLRNALQSIGVLRESGHEHLNGSIVVPLFDETGAVVQLYGRKIRDDLRAGTAYHLYLAGEHAGVFNLAYLNNNPTREIILCEALMDALTFWRWGFKNVTSSFGVNGFTDELLQCFKSLGIERVLIAYDRDEAGNVAADTLAARLGAEGFSCYRILFPKGMDANQYACQMQPADKALGLAICKAEWMCGALGKEKIAAEEKEIRITEPVLVSADTFPSATAPCVALPPASMQSLAAEVAERIDKEEIKPVIKTIEATETACVLPPLPAAAIILEIREEGLFLNLGERTYRVRGLDNNANSEHLKIQLLVQRGDAFFIDKLDLYSSKQRQVFINQACIELGVSDDVLKKDLGKLLLALEQEQLKKNDSESVPAVQSLTSAELEAALALLCDKNLPERILADFKIAGVVGEETNKLVGYLACVSRKLDRPLAVVIQSSSAAGKSSLMDAVLAFMPEDERVQYSAMTGQSLFYMGETRLKNKILAISEEEGAHTASYALKLLQSEGEVTIASTGKDDASGQLVTREYKVEGPVMLFLTTTAIDIDEELLNRCLVLTVNESREQTEAIHHAQRLKRTLKGLESKIEKSLVLQLHRNAQRLLKPLTVINPYADQLTFLADKTRTRRDHEKYLTLIDSIALLHQYQREIKTLGTLEYIEVTTEDIALANRLAHEVLGKTLDELPPQTRKLLKEIQMWVVQSCKVDGIEQRDFRFSRKQIREQIQWSDNQLKIHCKRLEEMEYLLVHRGSRGQSLEYELLYSGNVDDNQSLLMGLVDSEKLKNHIYDKKKLELMPTKLGSSWPQVGAKEALHEEQLDWLKSTNVAV